MRICWTVKTLQRRQIPPMDRPLSIDFIDSKGNLRTVKYYRLTVIDRSYRFLPCADSLKWESRCAEHPLQIDLTLPGCHLISPSFFAQTFLKKCHLYGYLHAQTLTCKLLERFPIMMLIVFELSPSLCVEDLSVFFVIHMYMVVT